MNMVGTIFDSMVIGRINPRNWLSIWILNHVGIVIQCILSENDAKSASSNSSNCVLLNLLNVTLKLALNRKARHRQCLVRMLDEFHVGEKRGGNPHSFRNVFNERCVISGFILMLFAQAESDYQTTCTDKRPCRHVVGFLSAYQAAIRSKPHSLFNPCIFDPSGD